MNCSSKIIPRNSAKHNKLKGMKFKVYLQQRAQGELLIHSYCKCFPASDNWREYKKYINKNNLSDKTAMQFDSLWDEFWLKEEMEHGNTGNS